MCSKRTRYSPLGVLRGMVAAIQLRFQEHQALVVKSPPELQTPSWKILNQSPEPSYCRTLPVGARDM